jgi:U6 snRNA-associated Sm-like protein LSm1
MDSFLPGSASLVDLVDSNHLFFITFSKITRYPSRRSPVCRHLAILRVTFLFSFVLINSQFASLILHETIERIYYKESYASVERGLFLIRGENVALLGQIHPEKDDHILKSYTKISEKEALDSVKILKKEELSKTSDKLRILKNKGFCTDQITSDAFMALGID